MLATATSYYAEGDKYPSVRVRDVDVAATVVRDTSLVDATGSVYLRLQPQLRPGGVDLFLDSIRGGWRRHLLLIGPDSVSVQFVSEPTIRVTGWDQFDEIVLVATAAERTGLAYQHLFTAQFDPTLPIPTSQPPSPPCSSPTTPTLSVPADTRTLGWPSP